MTRKEAIKFVLVRSVGNFLLLMSLYGVVMTFGPAVYYETKYIVAQARGVTFRVSDVSSVSGVSRETDSDITINSSGTHGTPDTPDTLSDDGPSFADILAGTKEKVLMPKDTEFSIVIPKIGASARVIPNVDPANPDEFKPILQQGVAHAKGTVFPGMQGNSYLFAHSADNWWDVGRYNAVFYLLKDLAKGDEVIIFFEDQRYDYVVTESFIAEASDVSLLAGEGSREREQVVLQTCWPPGTTLKRQFVIAIPKQAMIESSLEQGEPR